MTIATERGVPQLSQSAGDADPGLVRIDDEVGRFDTRYIGTMVALRWLILLAFIAVGVTGLVPMHPLAIAGASTWIFITNVAGTWVWRQECRVPWYDNTYVFGDILCVTAGVLASANLDYPIWLAFFMVMSIGAAELSTRLSILTCAACTGAYLLCAGILAATGLYSPNIGVIVVTVLLMGFVGASMTSAFDGSRRLRSYIRQMAVTDPLTGLANRRRLTSELALQPKSGQSIAVVIMDVDNFKQYNDSFGHLAGDQLLVRLAKALNHEFPDARVISRYGGDEFVVLLECDSCDQAVNRVRRILEGGPYEPVPVSVGIAVWPIHGATLDGVLAAADDCLRSAKTTNKGGIIALSAKSDARIIHSPVR